MGIGEKVHSLRILVFNNKKIIENYFFMTVLQVLNSFFYLLIYPYLIRALGGSAYGLYVFATSISTYFLFVINFGFDLPATKAIAENVNNKKNLENILSSIFTLKTYLFLVCLIIFIVMLYTIPIFGKNKSVFFLCFISVYSFVLFPQWFFQGMQSMKTVTYIQLAIKLLSLPLIVWLIKKEADLFSYVCILTCTNIAGGIIAFYIIKFKLDLKINWLPLSSLKIWFNQSQPFFLSSLAGSLKEYSIPIIIGSFFGMKEVAIYDLANKIVMVPRTIFMSVNAAIFPKLIINIKNDIVKNIIRIEVAISLFIVFLIVVFGRFIIHILGGAGMEDSYYLSILLAVTIVSWLVVGAYINFVFIPNNINKYIAINQVMAMCSFFILCIGGLLVYNNIMVLGFAIALSGILEIVYCVYITYKNKYLA